MEVEYNNNKTVQTMAALHADNQDISGLMGHKEKIGSQLTLLVFVFYFYMEHITKPWNNYVFLHITFSKTGFI